MEARRSVYDRDLTRQRQEVSLSAFGFLFSEIVQQIQKSSESIGDLEGRLEQLGFGVGVRILELLAARDRRNFRRKQKLIPILRFVSTTVWKAVFGRDADRLEKSSEKDDEYYIHEQSPLTNEFISVPREYGGLNCAAYIAGVVCGILDASGFKAKVTAVQVEAPAPGERDKTVYVVKFSEEVMQREAAMGS